MQRLSGGACLGVPAGVGLVAGGPSWPRSHSSPRPPSTCGRCQSTAPRSISYFHSGMLRSLTATSHQIPPVQFVQKHSRYQIRGQSGSPILSLDHQVKFDSLCPTWSPAQEPAPRSDRWCRKESSQRLQCCTGTIKLNLSTGENT